MLNFKKALGRFKKKKLDSEGIRLLATMLVCFPEITTVQYEPNDRVVEITFTLRITVDQEGLNELAESIAESLRTYHALEHIQAESLGFSVDLQNDMSFLHISRDLTSITRGELTLLTEWIVDRFGEKLILDVRGRSQLEQDFLVAQEDMLDQMLVGVQEMRLADRLVGIREEDRVMVFKN